MKALSWVKADAGDLTCIAFTICGMKFTVTTNLREQLLAALKRQRQSPKALTKRPPRPGGTVSQKDRETYKGSSIDKQRAMIDNLRILEELQLIDPVSHLLLPTGSEG